MIALPNRLALFADAHGHVELLRQALRVCRHEEVEEIVLLGDLVDRSDQADACALELAGWKVSGVFGNHEQQMVGALVIGDDLGLRPETIDLFMGLEPTIVIDSICFCHDGPPRANHHDADHFFNPAAAPAVLSYHIVFSGHTHFRHARDERGPLELSTNSITIHSHRHYLINPGAMTAGQFAIWDRAAGLVRFFTVRP
ncbi:MAG: metallophosphoesterase family protein [Chloroflexi bacterium]|nr:metallophosphoesterase family protein [Chloroflexota bacterium]